MVGVSSDLNNPNERQEALYFRSSHRLCNPGTLDLIMTEAQRGECAGEPDNVRFEGTYGRA